MQTSHLAPRVQRERDELKAENATLRRRVKEQDEFIQSLRAMIRDFVYGEGAATRSLGRHLNGGR